MGIRTLFLIIAIFLLSRNIAIYIHSGKTEDTFGEILKSKRNCDSNEIIITSYILGLLFIFLGNFIKNSNIKNGFIYGGMVTLGYTTYLNWGNIKIGYRLLLLTLFTLSVLYKDVMGIIGIPVEKDVIYDDILKSIYSIFSKYKEINSN